MVTGREFAFGEYVMGKTLDKGHTNTGCGPGRGWEQWRSKREDVESYLHTGPNGQNDVREKGKKKTTAGRQRTNDRQVNENADFEFSALSYHYYDFFIVILQ